MFKHRSRGFSYLSFYFSDFSVGCSTVQGERKAKADACGNAGKPRGQQEVNPAGANRGERGRESR